MDTYNGIFLTVKGVRAMKVEDMDVFKMAHEMTLKIYKITARYPDNEKFGLVSQMRRASGSICMNLMEGVHRISMMLTKLHGSLK